MGPLTIEPLDGFRKNRGPQPRSITSCTDSLGLLSGLQLGAPFRDIFVAWVGGRRIASVA